MPVVTMKELLEAGVHFGHQSKRWNPKMGKYIYSSRNNIHVIDLHKTIPLIEKAFDYVKNAVATNGTVLFVGTKNRRRMRSRKKPNGAACSTSRTAGSAGPSPTSRL